MTDSDEESIQFNAEPTPRHGGSATISRIVSPTNAIVGSSSKHLSTSEQDIHSTSTPPIVSKPPAPSNRPTSKSMGPRSSSASLTLDSPRQNISPNPPFYLPSTRIVSPPQEDHLSSDPARRPNAVTERLSLTSNVPVRARDKRGPDVRESSSRTVEYRDSTPDERPQDLSSEAKMFMNVHSNVFGEVLFRKMAPDTKFSRLLKSLLVATRDHLRNQQPSSDANDAPLPPPPISSGDLYFVKSGALVEQTATPRQYGIDRMHTSEENSLDLFFNYHPLGKYEPQMPRKESEAGKHVLKLYPPSNGDDPTTRRMRMPPPPSHLPVRLNNNPPSEAINLPRTKETPEVPKRRLNQGPAHVVGGLGKKNLSNETPQRRRLAHEPKTAQDILKNSILKTQPNEAAVSVAVAPPHLTNRSLLSRRKGSNNRAESASNEVPMLANETDKSRKNRDAAVPAHLQQSSTCVRLQSELELEIEKAVSLLSSRRTQSILNIRTASDDDSDQSAHESVETIGGEVSSFLREVEREDIVNYHAQLMQQLRLERSRQFATPET